MSIEHLLLIIDDDPDFQEQFSTLARMAGYYVEPILDGRSALQRMEKDPIPTMILLDAMLPFVTGGEVLAALRANEKWARVPVYILTADVRFAPGLHNRLPDAPQADGILEKGADTIGQVRALLAHYKKPLTL